MTITSFKKSVNLLFIFFSSLLFGCFNQNGKLDQAYPLDESGKPSDEFLRYQYGKAMKIAEALKNPNISEDDKTRLKDREKLNIKNDTIVIPFHGLKEDLTNYSDSKTAKNKPTWLLCDTSEDHEYALLLGKENIPNFEKTKYENNKDLKEEFKKLTNGKIEIVAPNCRSSKERIDDQVKNTFDNIKKIILENPNKKIVFLGYSFGGLVAGKMRKKLIDEKIVSEGDIRIATASSPLKGFSGSINKMIDLVNEEEKLKIMLENYQKDNKISYDLKQAMQKYIELNKQMYELNPQAYEKDNGISYFDHHVTLLGTKDGDSISKSLKNLIDCSKDEIFKQNSIKDKQDHKTKIEEFIAKYKEDDPSTFFEKLENDVKKSFKDALNELYKNIDPDKKPGKYHAILDMLSENCKNNASLFNEKDLHIVGRIDPSIAIKSYIVKRIENDLKQNKKTEGDINKMKNEVASILNTKEINEQIEKIAKVHNIVLSGEKNTEGSDWMVPCSSQYYSQNRVAYVPGSHTTILGSDLSQLEIVKWIAATEQ